MRTDRTPQEWAELCAEKVMGWHRQYGVPGSTMEREWFWTDSSKLLIKHDGWSPYNDSASALEVLKRLIDIITERSPGRKPAQRPDTVITLYGDPAEWAVRIGYIVSAHASGDHFGPAVCELAAKMLEANHAQTS